MKDKRISETISTGIVRRISGDRISYVLTVPCGMDVNGKQNRKTENISSKELKDRGITTIKKADKYAKEKYIEFKNRCYSLSSLNENMRFKDLCEEYFKICDSTHSMHNKSIKEITIVNYKSQVKTKFAEPFGNMKLKDFKPKTFTDFFSTYKIKGEPVKPSTAKKMYTVLQSIFHFAVSQGYIKESPCNSKVNLPQKDVNTEEKRKFLTEEELPRFIKMFDANNKPLDRIVLILLHTGMRSGEVLGLSWSDLDFERRLIHVNHTLCEIGGKHFLTSPKTKNSKRIIPMSSTVYELFMLQKKHQMELQSILPTFAHPEMVFTSEIGNYKDRCRLNLQFRRFLKGTEFEFMTLHCLRHSNATLLLNQGVDLKIVSEHLGHSDISTTGNIYADVLESSKRKVAEIIELKLAN